MRKIDSSALGQVKSPRSKISNSGRVIVNQVEAVFGPEPGAYSYTRIFRGWIDPGDAGWNGVSRLTGGEALDINGRNDIFGRNASGELCLWTWEIDPVPPLDADVIRAGHYAERGIPAFC